jgi:hypothetical protein
MLRPYITNYSTLISTSTPAGKSSFVSASTVCDRESRMSISRLCVFSSNCERLFLSMRAAQHRPELPLGRQRNRSRNLGARLFRGAHDVGRRLIDQRVVECFEPDADLARHDFLVIS